MDTAENIKNKATDLRELGFWWERETALRITKVNVQLQPGIIAIREIRIGGIIYSLKNRLGILRNVYRR